MLYRLQGQELVHMHVMGALDMLHDESQGQQENYDWCRNGPLEIRTSAPSTRLAGSWQRRPKAGCAQDDFIPSLSTFNRVYPLILYAGIENNSDLNAAYRE